MNGDRNMISVLIVDDEREACTNLISLLTEYVEGEIVVVGKAHNTKEAEKLIANLKPDAVFLDIEMPNENAFHFLERISPVGFEVIFVTAYDEYAIRAFRLNAVDYILKPISIAELTGAVHKLREKIKLKAVLSTDGQSYADLAKLVAGKAKSYRIALKDNNVVEMVDFKDIYFIEAQGSYIRILFLKDNNVRELVQSGTLTDYEELMPVEFFFRIHKSYLINCLHVRDVLKGELVQVVIKEDFLLPVSRRRYVPLLEFLDKNGYYHE